MRSNAASRLLLPALAILLGSVDGTQARSEERPRTITAMLEPGTEIIVLPAGFLNHQPSPVPAPLPAQPAPTPTPMPTPAPVIPYSPETGGPGCGPDGCADGPCQLYYRDRPRGCKDNKRHTIVQNRLGEPDWYKFYRREHFGYHPTTWMPWPENWLMCRNPLPGPHPYDLKQPEPKKQTPPASSTDSDSRSRPRQPPERLPVEKEGETPKPLPKTPK